MLVVLVVILVVKSLESNYNFEIIVGYALQ